MVRVKNYFLAGLVLAVIFSPTITAAVVTIGGTCPTSPAGVPIPCENRFPGSGPAGGRAGTVSALALAILNILLSFVGILAVLFIIIGGIRYIIAHGNEEQAESAKQTIYHAIIGLVIVILSFAIIRAIACALIYGSNRVGGLLGGCGGIF